MLLSKLEIKGFKSFGDKIGIHFDSGITGIVGPNGCGKSNIVDAIRWVLGEQKIKNLRSEKMENVIFNGSRNRRPLQMAEASLTFENNRGLLPTEYSQVTITRRLYRSGESEYMLNNVACRLKDITDLFLDTGIGSDSYAIIELKMVDDLLNDKEHSRRGLFEEAAGISKFKIRKKQSLRKLEETDADLARVDDLLFEITKNMKSLERQAKQAERYSKLKSEYKTLSIEFAKLSIERLNSQLGSVSTDLACQSTAKAAMATEAEQLESRITQNREALHTEELKLAEGQRRFNAHFASIKQLESDQNLRKQQLKHTEDKKAALARDIQNDQQQVAQLEESIGQLQKQEAILQTEVMQAEQDLNNLKEAVEIEKQTRNELQSRAQGAANAARQKQQGVYQHIKNSDVRKMQLQSAQEELVRIEKQRQLHLDSAVDYAALKEKLALELEGKEAELKQLQAEDLAHRQKVEETEKALHALREELSQHNRHLDAQRNQLNLTRSMIENLEGFPDAIKFLSKNKDWHAPAPLLSDLIVCDPRYKKAVESYLEPYMNHYVVDQPEQALEAIGLLKNAQKGRANFIILSELEEQPQAQPHQATGLQPVLEMVTADARYQSLLRYLFQEAYIASAGTDVQQLPDSLTVILEDGAIIKKPLSLTGGSVGLFAGSRIGRAKNYEQLQKEVAGLTQTVEVLRKQFQDTETTLKALRNTTLFQPIRIAEVAMQKLQQEILTANLKHEQQLHTEQAGTRRRQEIEEKITALQREIEELEPVIAIEQQDLAQAEENANQLQQQWQQQTEKVNEQSGRFNQANLQYHQLKNKLGSLQQEMNFKTGTIQSGRNRIQHNTQALNQAQVDVEHIGQQLAQQEALLQEKLQQKTELSHELEELQKAFLVLRSQTELTERELRDLQRKRQVADELIFQLQSASNENNLKLVAIKERLSVEFNLTEEDLAQEAETSGLSLDELQTQIASLRAKLDAMGPVNPMALEAYEEVAERDVFIREQREDLLNAKKSLLDTISEIDTVAKEKYMASFHQIRENFIKVFHSLFTEDDSCDLVIAEPDNPLESRIDIIAKPKGKRPLTINQLSGGEKTLTAISLLFAIYLLKPAPFCIFDEVDAPLDDANIDKFNKIIQQFSGQSQFIIVTHNKRTMASTDVIYGITMLEPGVSRVLPVDLRAIA